jgi:AraC-like DNA-binding protein
MELPFNFLEKNSTLLIFFFNGIVFSVLLLKKGIQNDDRSSKWLSLLLFLFAMYITPYMLGYSGWYSRKTTREILFFVPFMQVLLIGPVVFFYTKSLLNKSFRLSRKDIIHLIPAIIYFLYSAVVFVIDKLILNEFYFYADGRDKDLSNWYQIAGVISMGFYLILSLRYYAYYKALVFQTVSFADTILFRWIKNFMLAFLGILILRIVFFVTNPEWGEFGSQYWHYLAFSVVFFYIAINGFASAVKLSALDNSSSRSQLNIFEEADTIKSSEQSDFESKETEIWNEKIEKLMKGQKVYQNPKLTLSELAQHLNTTSKTISSAINNGFKMNFNDYVNLHRIEAVKIKLKEGEHKNTTLLGIALDCGFNSKATFNRAFKKHTSLSPKDYLSNLESNH